MRKFGTIIVILFSSSLLAQTNNESLGTGAGSSISTGDNNVFIGDNAGMSVSSGSSNTMVGEEAGANQTTAYDNTFIGQQAGFSVTTGTDNTFIGKRAGFSNTASDGTFVGSEAGYMNTSGFDNVFIGEQAGYYNTTGGDDVFVGEDAGFYNTTASGNTAIGSVALRSNLIGRYNTAIGNEAGYDIGGRLPSLNATRNTVVGNHAGVDIGNGVGNTCIGDNACPNSEYADFNTFVGLQAGYDNNRTDIDSTNNAQRNTGLGTYAGYTNREGTDNVWIGAFSDSGSRLSAFDHEAEVDLMQNGVAWRPGDFGSSAGADNTIFRTTVMGAFASAGENDSIAIGYNSRADRVNSIAIGANASGTATDDITLGYSASNTGNKSITIGNTTTSTHVDAITIGYGATTHADSTAIIGNSTTTNWDPNTDAVTSLGRGENCYEDPLNPPTIICDPMYRFTDVASNKISVNATSTNAAEIDMFADAGAANDDKWTISVADGGDFSISSFVSGVDVNKLTIANTGNVVIAGDLALNSDRRLKTKIVSIADSLNIVKQLDGKSYHWKDKNRKAGEHFGFIAQDVEKVLPQLVSSDDEDIKSVNYQGMIPILANAIKELNEKSDRQEQTIKQLQDLIQQQQALIVKLAK